MRLDAAAIEREIEDDTPAIKWRLDDRIVGISLLFERTARNQVAQPLHALERLRLLQEGAVFGAAADGSLPKDQAALLDCMTEAGDFERAFVKILYWQRGAVWLKARKLGLNKTRFYEERARVLFEFRGALRSKGFRL
jgi:hypothetical protein